MKGVVHRVARATGQQLAKPTVRLAMQVAMLWM
jgi:hypothetical protein